MKWEALQIENGELHVVPIRDLKPHKEGADCWCCPTDDEGIWVHHSMDQREAFEEAKRVMS